VIAKGGPDCAYACASKEDAANLRGASLGAKGRNVEAVSEHGADQRSSDSKSGRTVVDRAPELGVSKHKIHVSNWAQVKLLP